jgi:hypothetical protein
MEMTLTDSNQFIATGITGTLVAIFFLGPIGYLFNQFCNWAYALYVDEPAEMPMKIAFVLTYVVGVQIPVTYWLLTTMTQLITLLQQCN